MNSDVNLDLLELDMLTNFFDYLSRNPNCYYVNWNMKSITYGFEALMLRYQILADKKPFELDVQYQINLDALFQGYYGEKYVKDKRLQNLKELNTIDFIHFLNGEQESECYENGEYIKLQLSTQSKVSLISKFLSLHLSNKLKTERNSFTYKLNYFLETNLYKIVSVIVLIVTLIYTIIDLAKKIFGN